MPPHTLPRLSSRAGLLRTLLALLALPSPLLAQRARAATTSASPVKAAPPAPTTLDPALLSSLRYRMVGPARGGRVTAVAGVASQPTTFYMGAASGGVFKTTDAGTTWVPVTDGQIAVGSIGAIAVAPSNSDVVYVGTGSDGIRSNVSIGRGVYRSGDAGRTWSFVGLRDVGQIGAVRVDPANPDVVYVAAMGNPFARNVERGIFRTRDGGKSWQKVLFVSDSVGASDVELKPGDPATVYAFMWHGQRKPWTIVSGSLAPASGAGFYRSTDGGDHWTRITAGLPDSLVGKGNLAVSDANPARLYALVEAKPGGGLYRSDDGGSSWTLASSFAQLITRPFYYTTLAADPTNADVVYAGAENFYKSADAGRSWRGFPTPHGDNHEMWINPRDGKIMIQSNDGGANVSLDGGRTWSTQYNQPTAEIYGVWLDDQVPYRLYGAQQDNTTLIVPSLPLESGRVEEWRTGPGCETGPIMPHPTNPDTVYGSCKGQFSRMWLTSGQEKQYWVGGESLYGNAPAQLAYRFQRVSPMEISPWDPRVIYYGSQYVHRTRDEGVTWERISPDLTANDPALRNAISGEPITRDMTGEEMYPTLYAIRESPLERGVIWTGANDGPFHISRDNGKTWTNITPKDLPPGGRVQYIEVSPRRKGTAYYAVYRYLLGDFQPYIYRTTDYGRTWKRLTDGKNGIPADDPTRVVREDPDRPGLLYAGTEFGMYVSFDDGARWFPFQLNLPVTPITDLKVHGGDLVVATQGRSFWILDDLAALRQLSDSVMRASAHLFAPPPTLRLRYSANAGFGRGGGPAAPQYPRPGVTIDYWLADASAPVRLAILDSAGKLVREFESTEPARASASVPAGEPNSEDPDAGPRRRSTTVRVPRQRGLNRFIWDMNYPGPIQPALGTAGGNGPMALPGRYTVRLTVGDQVQAQPFVLRVDPRVTRDGVTATVLAEQFAHNIRARDLVSDADRLVWRVQQARRRLERGIRAPTPAESDTAKRLAAVEAALVTPPVRYSAPGLQDHIRYLYGMTIQADQKVGRDAIERYRELRAALDRRIAEVNAILGPEPVSGM